MLQNVASLVHRHRVAITLALVAVLLRTHRLTEVFASSDAADLAYRVVRQVCGGQGWSDAMTGFTLWRLGAVQPVIIYLHALVADSLGIPMESSSWVATTIVVSGVGTFFAYLLAAELAGTRSAGFWAALMLAVSPIHIMLGRHLGAPWAHEILFQLAILWLLVRQIRKPSRAARRLLLLAVALYFWCGNQMLAIVPTLGVGVILGYWDVGKRIGLKAYLLSRFASWFLLAPVASAGWLLVVTFSYREGHLAHALFDKEKALGWYYSNWQADLTRDIGYVPLAVGCLSLLLLLVLVMGRKIRPLPGGILLAYFACYTLPFWVAISRSTTLTTGYVVYSITAMLVVAAVVPFALQLSSKWSHLLPAIVVLFLFAGSFSVVYRHWKEGASYLGVQAFQGAFKANNGTTTAAAFVRLHSGNSKARVFSDASGGAGLEPPIMSLYFRRPQFSLYDARQRSAPYKRFRARKDEIEYLVVEARNKAYPRKYFGAEFEPLLRVRRDEKTLLYVFGRDEAARLRSIDVAEGHRMYLDAYPTLCSR